MQSCGVGIWDGSKLFNFLGTATTYTATFNTQYQLTMAASPPDNALDSPQTVTLEGTGD